MTLRAAYIIFVVAASALTFIIVALMNIASNMRDIAHELLSLNNKVERFLKHEKIPEGKRYVGSST